MRANNDPRKFCQALIALKKGAQLLKYGRKGKPKFYQFRLSNVSPEAIPVLLFIMQKRHAYSKEM